MRLPYEIVVIKRKSEKEIKDLGRDIAREREYVSKPNS